MVSVLVEYVISEVSASIHALTMSLYAETEFPEVLPIDMTHPIFPSALTKVYWNKHIKLKWLLITANARSLPNDTVSRAHPFSVAFPQFHFLPLFRSTSCI
jgi:hypothetical protein